MAGVGRGISNGPNSRPLDDTVATTGPGLPDDALAQGEGLDDAMPGGQETGSPDQLRKRVFGEDTAEDEPEAHPS